jgi:hypothetical protein
MLYFIFTCALINVIIGAVGGYFLILRTNEVKTKKLVLGFCALAAVTGSAAQMAVATEEKLQAVEMFDLLMDARSYYTPYYSVEGRRHGACPYGPPYFVVGPPSIETMSGASEWLRMYVAEDARLAYMTQYEVDYVRNALWLEHRAYFLFGIACEELNKVKKMPPLAPRKLLNIWKRAKRVRFSFAKKITDTEDPALKKYLAQCREAADYMETAQELKEEASKWRNQRIAYLTVLCAAPEEEDEDIFDDRVKEENARYETEKAIAKSITDAIRSHTDDRWSDYMVDGYYDLCSKFQEVYAPEALGYDHTTGLYSMFRFMNFCEF